MSIYIVHFFNANSAGEKSLLNCRGCGFACGSGRNHMVAVV